MKWGLQILRKSEFHSSTAGSGTCSGMSGDVQVDTMCPHPTSISCLFSLSVNPLLQSPVVSGIVWIRVLHGRKVCPNNPSSKKVCKSIRFDCYFSLADWNRSNNPFMILDYKSIYFHGDGWQTWLVYNQICSLLQYNKESLDYFPFYNYSMRKLCSQVATRQWQVLFFILFASIHFRWVTG